MPFRTGLLGKKLGMTSIFTANGDRSPVTAVHAGPCVVLDKLTPEKNGYAAVKIGFGEKALKRTKKPELGLFTKASVAPQRFIREVRLEAADLDKFEVGKTIPLTSVFTAPAYIDVEGTSKGKGFQGVMKRHHMPGFRATHGTHEFFRHGGSIGCRLTPGRVHKGKRMSGHMGDERKTIQNLELVEVIPQDNVVLVRGPVPGGRNGYLLVQNAVKKTLYKRKRHEVIEEKSKNPMKASKAGAGAAKPKK